MVNWWAVQDEAYETGMQVLETQRSEPVALSEIGTETKRGSHSLFGLLASTLKCRVGRL